MINMSRELERLQAADTFLALYLDEFGTELMEEFLEGQALDVVDAEVIDADEETDRSGEEDGVDSSEEGDVEGPLPEVVEG
jgi:hypothetical protein